MSGLFGKKPKAPKGPQGAAAAIARMDAVTESPLTARDKRLGVKKRAVQKDKER